MALFDNHKNFAYTTVTNSPGLAGTSISVTSTAAFPAVGASGGYNIVVCPANQRPKPDNAEVLRVTTVVNGTTFTVTRAQEGSTARNIAAGDQLYLAVTAGTIEALENAINSPGVSTLTPYDSGGDSELFHIDFLKPYQKLDTALGTVNDFMDTVNRAAGRSTVILVHNGMGELATIGFNANWKALGVQPIESIADNQYVVYSLTCFGTAETDVYITAAAQPA